MGMRLLLGVGMLGDTNQNKVIGVRLEMQVDRGEPMTFVSMQHMPLTRAYLCQDCNCIGNCAEQCPACASHALIGLAGVLNRDANDETPHALVRMQPLAA